MSNPRFMIAATGSGSGKTMITCGLLQALKMRGMAAGAFKCGPDYIDPMFHEKVLHIKSRNLDPFFTDRQMTRYLFQTAAKGMRISIMEGVMGYYDGLGGISTRASAYELARITETPVILVVNTKGMSLSVLPLIQGFLQYQPDSRIQGVILNQMSGMLYPKIKAQIEAQLQIPVLGYVERIPELTWESRHLGLMLPDEVRGLAENIKKLADIMEKTLDIDAMVQLADRAEAIDDEPPEQLSSFFQSKEVRTCRAGKPVVAVAKDAAFCFLYQDNLRLIEELGGTIRYFSPLQDHCLPKDAGGLLLCGGYPELYAKELAANQSIRREIAGRIISGMPVLAECGGFLYLHKELEDLNGEVYEMAGVIDGRAYYTGKLQRFGYVTLESQRSGILGAKSQPLRAHEFHYFESTSSGADFLAEKPAGGRSWRCIHGSEQRLMGFPHLYYYANPEFVLEFLQACIRWGG